MFRVLFVCMANLCRSPIACNVAIDHARAKGLINLGWSAIFKRDALSFASAGTHTRCDGEPMDNRGQLVLKQYGYKVRDSRSRRITQQDCEKFDLILAMDASVLLELKRLCPEAQHHKLKLFLDYAPGLIGQDVPDPYYGDVNGFETVLLMTEDAVKGLLATLQDRISRR